MGYPNDAFEIIIEETLSGHIFQVICHDCDGRRVATKFQGSIAKLQIHLHAESHVSNVMSKLDRLGELPRETVETKRRMDVLKRIASQRGHDQNQSAHRQNPAVSLGKGSSSHSTPRRSTSPGSMEILQSMYELPPKAFKYKPPRPRTRDALADRNSSSVHDPAPPIQNGPSHPTPPSTNSLQAPDDSFRREVSKRFEVLEESNRKKKTKLEHYGTLLGQTNNKYGEIEKEIASLRSREAQHAAHVQSMRDAVISGMDNLVQLFASSQAIPSEVSDQLQALLGRDEQHESRWVEVENFRTDLSRLLQTLGQRQDGLEDKLDDLLNRENPTKASADIAGIDERIQELESSKIQLLESQNELEQENTIMNARFALLERHDNSLEEATQLITSISDRIQTLETARGHILEANESFAKSLKKLIARIEAVEEGNQSTMNLVESVRDSVGPLNESIDLLTERFSAQDKHIENLTKKVKKFDEWVKYFSDVVEIQKTCIEDLQNKQVSEMRSRKSFEQRMEEMMKLSVEREEKMAERIKSLEKKEERSTAHIALLKTYSTPRSVAGSDNERGGSSTPKSSSLMAANNTASRVSQLATGSGSGTSTPIRPPSRTSITGSISRSFPTSNSSPAVVKAPASNSNAETPIRPPPSSLTSTSGSKNLGAVKNAQPAAAPPRSSQLPSSSQPSKISQPTKSSQPLIPNRKPRKF